MTDNSGFFGPQDGISEITTALTEITILGQSRTHVFGSANRYGRKWFFKGVAPDCLDSAQVRQGLLKEFDIQAGLSHPGIARAVSMELVEGFGLCLMQEWIEGATLAEAISSGTLSDQERMRLLHEIIDAASYLHACGIVHRDLKPANIMIRRDSGSTVIIDFGLADTDAHLLQKFPGGTEGYASERQHSALTPYAGDDVHALGVIISLLVPSLSSISRNCIAGKYANADQLRRAISRRRRRRQMAARLGVGLLIFSLILTLGVMNLTQRQKSEALKAQVENLTDTLSTVSGALEAERTLRLESERRQALIQDLKTRLNQRLLQAFARFKRTQNPDNPDTDSMVQLIKILSTEKDKFLQRETGLNLSDSESLEVEMSFITQYNKILEQWNQSLTDSRRKESTD